jgi:hypothetical protein
LKHEVLLKIFKNSAPASQETKCNSSQLLRQTGCCIGKRSPILWESYNTYKYSMEKNHLFNIKAGGTYGYHYILIS